MHRDFFFIAATPVVKVFLTLVARRTASWDAPSRPAIEPDKTVAPPARFMHRELMIFLQQIKGLQPAVYYPLKEHTIENILLKCVLISEYVVLTSGSPAKGL